MTITLIFILLTLSVLVLVKQQTLLSLKERRKSQALSISEAGLDAAIWRLERNETLPISNGSGFVPVITGSNTQGSYEVDVRQPSAQNSVHYQLTASGKFPDTGEIKTVMQDVYYINLSKSTFSYSGVNGGQQITGNVVIRGPFYSGGDLSLGGSTTIKNEDNSTGNPLMVRGNLSTSGSSVIGGATQQIGPESPMAVFVTGTISDQSKVHTLVSKEVPQVTLPEVVRSLYLDSAQSNNTAIFGDNVTLGNSNVRFGKRSGSPTTYTFDYNGSTGNLTIAGTVFIDGNLTINKNVTYSHPSGYTQATIFIDGKITINNDVVPASGYPTTSLLSFVNPDTSNSDDMYVNVTNGTVKAFLYSAGTINIAKQVSIYGSIMANKLTFTNVPSIYAPIEDLSNNYPYLFPGKTVAFVDTANWRQVSPLWH